MQLRKKLKLWNPHKSSLEWYLISQALLVFNATGAKCSGCFLLQKVWHRNILWLHCLLHVYEVVLSHVWDSFEIERYTAPPINIFKMLQDEWSKISCIDMPSLYQPIEVDPEKLIEYFKKIMCWLWRMVLPYSRLPYTCSIVSYLLRDGIKHILS